MAQLVITYWRDIPAQVTAKEGRTAAKRELSLRFTEAIDMAAMRSGAAGTDDYLAEWRRGAPGALRRRPRSGRRGGGGARSRRITTRSGSSRLAKNGGREEA